MSSAMGETPVDESCDYNDFPNGGSCSGESLFGIMPRIPIFDSNGEGSITDSEQVRLDTNREPLTSPEESGCRTQRSNQYMENIKYSGYEGESDYSSDEDANRECCHTAGCSKEKSPCKLCCSSHLAYDSNLHCTKHAHSLFKYSFPYEPSASVPLLQLYSQRCEENYNLDIDIVLIYVNSVINQLKRISDGEYLTKEVKDRWMAVNCELMPNAYTEIEVASNCESLQSEKDLIVLSNDSPLNTETNNDCPFECEKLIKEGSRMLTDSEEDMTVMRIEGPDKVHPTEYVGTQQNIQITFKMEPSLLEYFFWSIDTWKKLEERKICVGDKTTESMLPVPTKTNSFLEIPKNLIEQYPRLHNSISKIVDIKEVGSDTDINVKLLKSDSVISQNNLSQSSSKTTVTLADVLARLPKSQVNSKHSPFNPTSVDELKVSIQNLDIQPCLMEETNEDIHETVTKSKSTIYKSPYENQSPTLEEKRRNRLLEIRDNRDKKTIKTIHDQQVGKFRRNAKSRVTASKSVTKLSITNKSFYNSIFGQNNKIMNTKNLKMKTNCKYLKKDKCLRDTLRQKSKERVLSPTTNRINIPSEVKLMLRDLVESKGRFEQSNTQILKPADSRSSMSSNSIDTKNIKVNLISEKKSSDILLKNDEIPDSIMLHNTKSMHHLVKNNDGVFRNKPISNISFTKISTDDCRMLDPIDENDRVSEKKYPSRIELECRESIGKIYDLMRKLGTTDKVALKNTKTKFTTSSAKQQVSKGYELPTWDCKSSGSYKQCSNTSFNSLSGEKLNKIRLRKLLQSNCVKEPKVIIKAKDSTKDKNVNDGISKEKDYKKLNLPTSNKPMPPNPLPAITKVLNEMNNLQKGKQKIKQEQRQLKYTNTSNRDSKKSPRLDNRIYLDNRDEKLLNRTQQNPDKRSKTFYKIQDTVIEKNRTPRRASEITDEEREARGEAVRGPPTSRLDALALPRQSYVKAHSEQIASKYGRSLMTERLQRFVHVQQSYPPVTYQQYVKLKSGFVNENKPSVTRNPAAEKCKLERSSTFVECSKTISSTSREGLILKRNPGSIASPRSNKTSPKINASCVLPPKTKQVEMKPRIPLIPQTSEHYELEKEDALETLINEIVKSQLNSKQLKITQEKQHCATKGKMVSNKVRKNLKEEPVLPLPKITEAGVAKVKNCKVIIETEDLVDSDIYKVSNSPIKHLHFENPASNNDKVNAVATLERAHMGANSNDNYAMKQNIIISNVPHSNVSLKNILVFQAGDASNTAVACKSTSMRNFFNKNSFKVKSYENICDIKGLISLSKELSAWDVHPIPRQISTVYYSLPEMCAPKVMSKSKLCYTASTVDFNIMHRSTEYMVSSTTYQSQISYSQHNVKSKQAKPDNTEVKSLGTNSVTNTGVEGQLESTSSIDVLFKLLNEIHSISMGTMQVASVYGFQMVENVKPLQYATTYNIMTTTEEATVGYMRHKDIQEEEYYVNKAEGLKAYENSLETKLLTNHLQDRPLNQSLHTLLSPYRCKETSVTGLNIDCSPSINAICGNATRKPYDPDVRCKKSNKVKRHKVKLTNNESSGKVTNNRKLKRDLLIYMYVIIIVAVFTVVSVPGMYSIPS